MERVAVADAREFVLCFDGTGYKFRDEAGSNVLKIYRVSPCGRNCFLGAILTRIEDA